MPACPNCQEPVKDTWKHCPHCSADLKEGHYSSDDDPVEKLTKRVNKMDEFLTEKFRDDKPNDDDDKNKKGGTGGKDKNKPPKRRTLFGD